MPDQRKLTVFSSAFLELVAAREPVPLSTFEATLVGPWTIVPRGQDFAVLRESDGTTEAVTRFRDTALLLAAVLPATGRGPLYWLASDQATGRQAFALKTVLGEHGPTTVGTLRSRNDELLATLSTVDHLLRAPASLAFLLEAASTETLSQAGSLLAGRLLNAAKRGE